jgi:hypothetical protein
VLETLADEIPRSYDPGLGEEAGALNEALHAFGQGTALRILPFQVSTPPRA